MTVSVYVKFAGKTKVCEHVSNRVRLVLTRLCAPVYGLLCVTLSHLVPLNPHYSYKIGSLVLNEMIKKK